MVSFRVTPLKDTKHYEQRVRLTSEYSCTECLGKGEITYGSDTLSGLEVIKCGCKRKLKAVNG